MTSAADHTGSDPGSPVHGHATTENWSESDTHLVVTQPHGYMCNLSMHSKVPLPPEKVFEILTDPGNARIFKAIKAVKNRRVVYSDGHRQVVEVEQLGHWRFLMFSGTFTTKLIVEEDSRTRSISFRLAQPGWMKRFQGSWRIEPFNQESLDELVNCPGRPTTQLHRLQASMKHLQDRLHGRHAECSLVQLEQSVMPAFVPPPPADRLVKSIAAKQLLKIMNELRQEAERINRIKVSAQPGASKKVSKEAQDAKELSAHARKL